MTTREQIERTIREAQAREAILPSAFNREVVAKCRNALYWLAPREGELPQ